MIRHTALALLVSTSLAGCSLDFLAWPDPSVIEWPSDEERDWKSYLPFPIPEPPPATDSLDPRDPANDLRMALSRFGFILLAAGGVAGLAAWQNKVEREKNPKATDTMREDFGFPIAAFGLGLGIPMYIASYVLASQALEEAERKKLAPGP